MGKVGAGEAAGAGAVTTTKGGRGRGTRGGVLARLAEGRGAPPGPKPSVVVDSRGCIASCCCCTSARPSGDAARRRLRRRRRRRARRDRGGHGQAGGLDGVGPLCVELLEKGVGWATVVAAAGASAKPVPTSVGTAKTEAKAVSAAGKTRPRSGQQSTVETEAETRATKLLEGAESSSILSLYVACVCENRKNRRRLKGAHPRQ